MESSILQGYQSAATGAFSTLSPDEQTLLQNWQSAARAVGIDAVQDLTSRPWPSHIDGTVIGVFEAGREAASWLVICHDSTWAVAFCAEGAVSGALSSLTAALSLIHPLKP